MISEEKGLEKSVEKKLIENTIRDLATNMSKLSEEEKERIEKIRELGLEAGALGNSSRKELLEDTILLRQYINQTEEKYSFSACEVCQRVFIMGESIRGIHGVHEDGRVSRVHEGKKVVLKYLDDIIEHGKPVVVYNSNQPFSKAKVLIPEIGLVKLTGKFESFRQDVVLWCLCLTRSEAEKRLAELVKSKRSWIETMVSRFNLTPKSTCEEVQKYLNAEKPRFIHTQGQPSVKDIDFWIRVTGTFFKCAQPDNPSFKQYLDVVAVKLGSKIGRPGRPSKDSKPKSNSGSDGSSDDFKSKTSKKKGPSFKSALSAIGKNGGQPEKMVIEEKEPVKKMKMLLRTLGDAEPTLPAKDWTSGINQSILSDRLDVVNIFFRSFGLELEEAVAVLKPPKVSRTRGRKKNASLDPTACVPGFLSKRSLK